MAEFEELAKAVIDAIDTADRACLDYAGNRICALKGGMTEEQIAEWRQAWPHKSLDDFRIEALRPILGSRRD